MIVCSTYLQCKSNISSQSFPSEFPTPFHLLSEPQNIQNLLDWIEIFSIFAPILSNMPVKSSQWHILIHLLAYARKWVFFTEQNSSHQIKNSLWYLHTSVCYSDGRSFESDSRFDYCLINGSRVCIQMVFRKFVHFWIFAVHF